MTRASPNKLKALLGNRNKPASPLPIVNDLFSKIDAVPISYTWLEKRAGWNRVTISRARNGHVTPSLPMFLSLAEAAGYAVTLAPLSDVGRDGLDSA